MATVGAGLAAAVTCLRNLGNAENAYTRHHRHRQRQRSSRRPQPSCHSNRDLRSCNSAGDSDSNPDVTADSDDGTLSIARRKEILGGATLFSVDEFVRDGMTVGLGAGPVANLIVEAIADRLELGGEKGGLQTVKVAPTSPATAARAASLGVPIARADASRSDKGGDAGTRYADSVEGGVDVMFLEVDMLQPDPLAIVKGRYYDSAELQQSSQSALRSERPVGPWDMMGREKAMASRASKSVVILEESQVVPLAGPVPIEVSRKHWEDAAESLDDAFLGDATVWRRSSDGSAHAGSGGTDPAITMSSNFIVDLYFEFTGSARDDVDSIMSRISNTPHVVAHGLWTGECVNYVVIGTDEGVTLCPLERVVEEADVEEV